MRKSRESNFELLRIVAMFMIVLYHLLMRYSYTDGHLIYRVLQFPLHIGVILFVLISGYYGIRPSIRGLMRLLAPVLVLYLSIELIYSYIKSGGVNVAWEKFLILTDTPYWFIRTYLWLFLASPVINSFLKDITWNWRIYSLCSFGFIALYMGATQGDPSLVGGRNLVNFLFLYILGNTLKVYKHKWETMSGLVLLSGYMILNIAVMVIFYWSGGNQFIYRLFFEYCGAGLMFNAVLLFLLFGKLHISSIWINSIAASMFTVYVIHEEPVVCRFINKIRHVLLCYVDSSPINVIMFMACYALVIMFVCICIDKILTPVWNVCAKIGNEWDEKLFKSR